MSGSSESNRPGFGQGRGQGQEGLQCRRRMPWGEPDEAGSPEAGRAGALQTEN